MSTASTTHYDGTFASLPFPVSPSFPSFFLRQRVVPASTKPLMLMFDVVATTATTELNTDYSSTFPFPTPRTIISKTIHSIDKERQSF